MQLHLTWLLLAEGVRGRERKRGGRLAVGVETASWGPEAHFESYDVSTLPGCCWLKGLEAGISEEAGDCDWD